MLYFVQTDSYSANYIKYIKYKVIQNSMQLNFYKVKIIVKFRTNNEIKKI